VKKILLLICFLAGFIYAHASLNPGDIVVVGFNAKGFDQIAIMATRSFQNEHFNITDAGWNAAGGFRVGEGTLISRVESMQAGEIITINLYSGYGSVGDEQFSMSGTFDLAASGDQLIIYQGVASDPHMVYALNYSSKKWATDASDAASSALPTGLTNGYSAVSLIQKESYRYAQKIDLSDLVRFFDDLGDYNSWQGKNDTTYPLDKRDFPSGFITKLDPGDVALIGFNDKNAEQLVFVAMREILGGTMIKITDKGWTGSVLVESEGTKIYVVPPQGIIAGQVISFSPNNTNSYSQESFALSTSGDQVLVYQGSPGRPRFIYAYNSRGDWVGSVSSPQTSMAPAIIGKDGLPAVRSGTQAQGNGYYIGAHSGTYSELLMAFADPANYLFAGEYNQSLIPAITPFTILPDGPPIPSFRQCAVFSSAASTGQNYISTKIFKAPGMDPTNLSGRTVCEINETVQYIDGLGRPVQSVTVQGSPSFADLVQPISYDAFGRVEKKYLPYAAAGSNGSYRSDALQPGVGQNLFYNADNSVPGGAQMANGIVRIPSPFSQLVFEKIPISRVVEQGAPGDSWQPVADSNAGHTVKTIYGTNTANDVKAWKVNDTNDGAVATFYDAGKLYKTVLQDENWSSTDGQVGTNEEFKDAEGRVVLKRSFNKNAAEVTEVLSTYYVYDDLGNLSYVLPPVVNEGGVNINSFDETQEIFINQIYGYHYDGRKRLIDKKIPGKGWEYMVYNILDQVVLTQDAVQAAKSPKEWLFRKYDALGRVVMTGLYKDNADRNTLQASLNSPGIPLWESRPGAGYSNVAFPTAGFELYTVNYYDDYNFDTGNFGGPTGSVYVVSGRIKGLQTGSRVKDLGTGAMLLTVNYYDVEGRMVQSRSENHLTGTDMVGNTYNFAGELTNATRTHSASGVITAIANRYEYDHMGRKLATMQRINTQGEVALNKLDYNELGQLKQKNLHSTDGVSFLQNTRFGYNERGWLKNSTSDQFSIQLNYNDALNVAPQYNGNISNQLWGAGSSLPNMYDYSYDKLNRLKKGSSVGISMSEELTYDLIGNISSLSRDGGPVNQYNYDNGSNRLSSVNGVTGVYVYDVNGNATTDGRNNTAISYNYLNLPVQINGSQNIGYTYNAIGEKLRKAGPGGTIDYVSGIQYKADRSIDFIRTDEGVARKIGANYSYEYNLTDHLGNVRVSFYKNPISGVMEILQRDDYYAFGLRKIGSPNSNVNKYLYNGKELQDELGQYDYGARLYDPVIGRWNVVDPMAEKGRRYSAYNYCFNNPIRFVDPDGMEGKSTHTDFFGNVIAVYDDGDLGVYRHVYAESKKDVDDLRSATGTRPGGGEFMGDTWTALGFADFDYFEATGEIIVQDKAQIMFDSEFATNEVGNILANDPSAYEYSQKAGGNGVWDIKAHSPGGVGFGSKLFGKYASARDAGNFAAGAVAKSSFWPGIMIDYGFGLYSKSGNIGSESINNFAKDIMTTPTGIAANIGVTANFGEYKLSREGIAAGKAYMEGVITKGTPSLLDFFKLF